MIPIRKDYKVNNKEISLVSQLEELEKKGFIKTITKRYRNCECGNRIYEESFSDRQLSFCACGKRVRKTNFNETDININEVRYENILSSLEKKLSPLGFVYQKEIRAFKNNLECPVYFIIPEFSTYNFIITQNQGSNCFFISIDLEKTKTKLMDKWHNKTFEFLDFLNIENSILEKNIDAITKYDVTERKNEKYEKDYLKLLKKSPQFVEDEFISFFIKKLKEKNNELQSYLFNLKFNDNSLLNSKLIVLGGPSNPDFYLINLHNYLSDGLKPEKYGEVKRYTKSKFTVENYGKVLVHSDEGDNLIIVTTNDIQKEVWIKIINLKRIHGYFKSVILDKDLLLTLLYVLKIDITEIL